MNLKEIPNYEITYTKQEHIVFVCAKLRKF